MKMLLLTAQRLGEVRQMRWDEIRGDVWHLSGDRTKNRRAHVVPLSPLALDILSSLRGCTRHVFVSGRVGDRPVTGVSHQKARFNEVSDWRVHDLRRTAATGMRQLGVDRFIVSRILNHADRSVTAIYDRYAPIDEMRQALEAWSTKVSHEISSSSS